MRRMEMMIGCHAVHALWRPLAVAIMLGMEAN